MKLSDRVRIDRESVGYSLSQLSGITGVSFLTLCRVERGDDEYSPEAERKLLEWLGDDVSHLPTKLQVERAEALGRIIARAFATEIQEILHETL